MIKCMSLFSQMLSEISSSSGSFKRLVMEHGNDHKQRDHMEISVGYATRPSPRHYVLICLSVDEHVKLRCIANLRRGKVLMDRKEINCIRVNIKDNVVTLIREVSANEEMKGNDVPPGVKSLSSLPLGHKVALAEIASGEKIFKYGEVIGYACELIKPGDHVHVHNIVSGRGRGDLE